MKKYIILPVLVLALALCGCSKESASSEATSKTSSVAVESSSKTVTPAPEPSVPGSSAEESVSVPEESSEIEESSASAVGTSFLVGLAGDVIKPSDITQVFAEDGGELTPEELTEENFMAVMCEGFTYVAEPTREARNAIDNADVFDSENMRFTDLPTEPLHNYARLDVGDKICGLTLKEANVNFARGLESQTYEMSDGTTKLGSELGLPEIYFMSSTATFEGELMMDGYICKFAEDIYGVGTGDIVFVPSDGAANIPVMSYRLSGDDGFHHSSQVYSLGGLTWQNEFGYVYLGNAAEITADISGLPDDGSFVKATVIVTNPELSSGVGFVTSVRAELDVVEIIA